MKQEKGSMHQIVRVLIDVEVSFSAMHDKEAMAELVEKGARNAFPNNKKHFKQLSYSVDNVQEHIFDQEDKPKGED
jgi:hypothetical protein